MDAKAALLRAIARGRPVPPVQVRPSPTTRQPPELAGLVVEELQYRSDDSSQGWVPLRLVKKPPAAAPTAAPDPAPTSSTAAAAAAAAQPAAAEAAGAGAAAAAGPAAAAEEQRLPVAILLHATGCDRDSLVPQQAEFAWRGYLVASIDCRYHGDRTGGGQACADARNCYEEALVRAWRQGIERPFLLDNVWDLQRLLDYLATRPDADMARVGMTGVSLGGMHTWLCAAADERVAVSAPMIGLQCFKWAVDNDLWQARAASIPSVFEAARQDMGKPALDSEVVAAVWDRLLPGLLQCYDAPMSLPLVAPRPFLAVQGELDPRCPMPGVHLAVGLASQLYAQLGAPEALQVFVEKGVGHECTPAMWRETRLWLDKHLRP